MKWPIIVGIGVLALSVGVIICTVSKWKLELDMLKCDDF